MFENFDSFVNSVSGFLWTYVLIALLVVTGLYFSVRTGFVQIRYLKEMVRVLRHGIVGHKTKGREISSFQAFCISTASRVGVGNIAGIAIAITVGGPGAVFWMWVIAIIGSASGFIESTLAQIYKVPYREGGYHGGPAYYIKNALKQPWVAALFAILISITFALIYNSVQSNTIVAALDSTFELKEKSAGYANYIIGLVVSLLTAVVIFGGAHRIAKVTEYMVPFMAGIYLLIAGAILFKNLSLIPQTVFLVLHDAFSPQAAVGGGLGGVILTGVKRGLFSNEAGEGSVPNAAACATTSHPVKQGLIQAFGVFVDTMFICTASAVIVLLSQNYTIGSDFTGIALVQKSLSSQLGSWVEYFMTFTILLFAFSSIVGNYYYGEVNIRFLTKNPVVMVVFRVLVVCMVFFGSIASLNVVWDLADLFMALLVLTNLYAIVRLGKFAFFALRDYRQQKEAGNMEPAFKASMMPDDTGVAAWGNENKYLETCKDE